MNSDNRAEMEIEDHEEHVGLAILHVVLTKVLPGLFIVGVVFTYQILGS